MALWVPGGRGCESGLLHAEAVFGTSFGPSKICRKRTFGPQVGEHEGQPCLPGPGGDLAWVHCVEVRPGSSGGQGSPIRIPVMSF